VNQISELKHTRAYQGSRTPLDLSHKVFEAVYGLVSYQALRKVKEQMELLSKPTLTPCSGLFTSSHGLPCAHELKRLLGIQEVLLLNHFHPHWHLKRSQQPQELILQPLRSVQEIERVSTIPASSTRREPSGFELVQAKIKAPMKCSRCHQVGHSKRQLICPLRYSELIALSSSTTIQPLLDAAPATQIVQSVQESATEASLHAVITRYQKDAMPESSLIARESPESSLVASPGKSPPWRARDFERGTVRAHFDAKEAEMEEYYSGFITQHGHLPQGSEDRYKKYDLRRRR